MFRRGTGGRLAPIPPPIQTGRSTSTVWAMDLGGTEYAYHCTDTGVEVIERDGDQEQVAPAPWRTETGRWMLGAPYTEPLDAPADPLEPLALDCQDHAERAVQVDEAGPGKVHPQDTGTHRIFTYSSPR